MEHDSFNQFKLTSSVLCVWQKWTDRKRN